MDLSKYSDEELNAMLGEQEQSSPDLSAYSDDELQSMLPPEPQAMPSAAKTALDQALQGATFGFGDELTSALASVPVSIATGMSVPEAYRAGQELSKQQLTQQQEQRPILSGAANIAGGIGTGAAGMATRGGTAIASGLSRGLVPQARGLAGRAANLFTKALIGGATGAASGAAYGAGTGEGNRMESARQGAVLGGAVGAAIPIATAGVGAAAGAALPKVDEGLAEVGRIAQKYKIPLSIDELTSSRAVKTAQKVSQEIPFSGQAAFRDKQMQAWTSGLMDQVGVKADKVTPEIMNKAFKTVGAKFDKLGAGKVFDATGFDTQVKSILDDAGITATEDAIKNFNKGVERVKMNIAKDGTISGERLSRLRSNINELSRKASSSDTKELLKDLENSIIDIMTAGDDVAKNQLSRAKYEYKNLLAIEPLAQKAKGGYISPSLLSSRVARIYGRAYTTGQAGPMGDLARVGSELLPELGGSDTAQKMLYTGGALFGLGAEPATAISVMAGNRAAQSGINRNQKLVNKMLQKGQPLLDAPSSKLRITPKMTETP